MVGDRDSFFKPECDVLETENYYYIFIDLPGVNASAIDVSYKDNKLEIKGEKVRDISGGDFIYQRAERTFGSFRIVFDWILSDVDEDNIDATYKDGVLFLKIRRKKEK